MKNTTKTKSLLALILSAGLFASAAPAVAVAPEKGGNPDDIEPILVPTDEACDFPLLVEGVNSNANIKTFPTRDGVVRMITAGRGYTLTYSRLAADDPESAVLDSLTLRPTGSVQKVEIAEDGTQTVTGTGTNGLILTSGDVPPSSAIQYQGKIVFTISPAPEFKFTLISTSGKQLDICEELSQ